MEYKVGQAPGEPNVSLSGRLTFADHQKFREIIDVCGNTSTEEFVIDLTELEFVDSTGLGMFFIVLDSVEGKNIRITLAGAQGQVRRMFRSAKFEKFFTLKD